jgi:hypothetical protein
VNGRSRDGERWQAACCARPCIEAANFGCFAPGQLAFIRAFGDLLLSGLDGGRYPLLPPGSVRATPEQLSATIRTAADRPDSPTRAGRRL